MRVLVPLPVIAVLVALLWFGFGRDPANVANPLVGRKAPSFALNTTAGRTINLASLRGKPVILTFFASWCTACRLEESDLVSTYNQWRHRVRFFGVIYEDSPSEAASFTRSHHGTWPDLVDPHSLTAVNYGVSGIPTTFFIDARGRITGYTYTLLPTQLRKGIRRALAA